MDAAARLIVHGTEEQVLTAPSPQKFAIADTTLKKEQLTVVGYSSYSSLISVLVLG